jgi:uncharacterized protein HemX
MSTGTIIAIVVVAVLLVALFAFVLPRMRRKAQERSAERQLEQRREHVAGQHRAEADTREREAEMAERKARLAQAEADKQRAEAQMHQVEADLHERGMADDRLAGGTDSPATGGGPRTGADEGRFERQPEQPPAETRRT